MPQRIEFRNREEWLRNRKNGLGGSDIAAVIGANPWMSNVELWEIKTGKRQQADISEKPFVQYGHDAEEHIRALFALDHPDLEVHYADWNSWSNLSFPWAVASLDGWTTEIATLRRGVLEIKTSEIQRSTDWEKWEGGIPQQYFCQVLFYMAVIEADFADLRAAIRYTAKEGDKRTTIRDYHIERSEVEEDIAYLMEQGRKFWEQVENGIRPALLLPEI